MSDADTVIATDLQPLLLELGKALFICQNLEESLCLLHSQMSYEESGGEVEAFRASWDFHSSKPLGNALNQLRKRIEIPDDLSAFLDAGLKMRNLIVHGFMSKNIQRILDPKGRLEVEKELEAMKMEIKKRDVVINKLLDAYFKKYGLSNDDLKKSAGVAYAALNTPKEGKAH